MVELKERLIEQIRATTDPEILKEVDRLLGIYHDDSDSYKLSPDQAQAVEEAQNQIKQGDFPPNEEANKATQEWLEKQ